MPPTVELSIRLAAPANGEMPTFDLTLCYRLERLDEDVMARIAAQVAEFVQRHEFARNAVKNFVLREGVQDTRLPTLEGGALCRPAQETAIRALVLHSSSGERAVEDELRSRFGIARFEQLPARHAMLWLLDLQRAAREKARCQMEASH